MNNSRGVFAVNIQLSKEAEEYFDQNPESLQQLAAIVKNRSTTDLINLLINPEEITELVEPNEFIDEYIRSYIKARHNWTDYLLNKYIDTIYSNKSSIVNKRQKECMMCLKDLSEEYACSVVGNDVMSKSDVVVKCPICGTINYYSVKLESKFSDIRSKYLFNEDIDEVEDTNNEVEYTDEVEYPDEFDQGDVNMSITPLSFKYLEKKESLLFTK